MSIITLACDTSEKAKLRKLLSWVGRGCNSVTAQPRSVCELGFSKVDVTLLNYHTHTAHWMNTFLRFFAPLNDKFSDKTVL